MDIATLRLMAGGGLIFLSILILWVCRRIGIQTTSWRMFPFAVIMEVTGLVGSYWLIQASGKSMWEWLDLLIVPVVLGLGALWFSREERKAEGEMAAARQQETALQAYLDKMTELLLEKRLRSSEKNAEVRDVARARTLTVLRGLDGGRKGMLVRFLKESGLIDKSDDKSDVIVNLYGADLTDAYLFKADLREVYLAGTDLTGSNLWGAYLTKSDLTSATLSDADLSHAVVIEAVLARAKLNNANLVKAFLLNADLEGANLIKANLSETRLIHAKLTGADFTGAKFNDVDLSGACLENAIVSDEQLAKAKHLRGATRPDGTKHE